MFRLVYIFRVRKSGQGKGSDSILIQEDTDEEVMSSLVSSEKLSPSLPRLPLQRDRTFASLRVEETTTESLAEELCMRPRRN